MPGRDVNSIIAGSNERRRGDPDMDFFHSHGTDEMHDLPAGSSAHNRIVYQNNALVSKNLPDGIELYLDSEVADRLLGFNKCSADIVISDQAEFQGNSAFLGIADGGRNPGIGHRHNDICIARDARAPDTSPSRDGWH